MAIARVEENTQSGIVIICGAFGRKILFWCFERNPLRFENTTSQMHEYVAPKLSKLWKGAR